MKIGTRFGKECWQYFNTKFGRNFIYDDRQKTVTIDITKYQKAFTKFDSFFININKPGVYFINSSIFKISSKTRREIEDSKENSRRAKRKRRRNKKFERISVKDKVGEIKILFNDDNESIKFENWKVKAEKFFEAVDRLNQTF